MYEVVVRVVCDDVQEWLMVDGGGGLNDGEMGAIAQVMSTRVSSPQKLIIDPFSSSHPDIHPNLHSPTLFAPFHPCNHG